MYEKKIFDGTAVESYDFLLKTFFIRAFRVFHHTFAHFYFRRIAINLRFDHSSPKPASSGPPRTGPPLEISFASYFVIIILKAFDYLKALSFLFQINVGRR